MATQKWNIGDVVMMHTSKNKELPIHGRIIYIDHKENQNEYGVLYYGVVNKELLTIQLHENKIEKPLNLNTYACPSHSLTMEYVDELARLERASEGTPIKYTEIRGECTLTFIFKDGSEDTFWSFEKRENNTLMIIDNDGNEILTEEELTERGIDHIKFMDTYTLWSADSK